MLTRPWKQHGRLRWLWVVLSSTTAIFHIGSRQGAGIRDLIGDAFLGWLVSDGYGACRKFKKRQRCLAHYADLRIMPPAAWSAVPAAVIAATGLA
jgi:hypothetical protein